jgi:hypothetical protein
MWTSLGTTYPSPAPHHTRSGLGNHLADGQFVSLRDLRLAGQLAADRRGVPAEEVGEPGLAARAALVVQRVADAAEGHGNHL